MERLVKLAQIAAKSSAPAFITGENGVGKEHFARILHDDGPRANSPFIAVNCAALPKDLIESELFGSKKGSYTGSVSDRQGLFRDAGQGTIFLDEIGEMPPEMQCKLLRVLQDGRVRPVGDTASYPIQCRVIAATNKHITDALRSGKLRMDLYYRLAVVKLHVPPLRERPDDIQALATYFFQQFSNQENKTIELEPDVLDYLSKGKWEGNVRQLQNSIHSIVIFSDGKVTKRDFMEAVNEHIETPIANPFEQDLDTSTLDLDTIIKNTVIVALKRCNWCKLNAAQAMGVGRQTFYNYLKKYNLEEYISSTRAATKPLPTVPVSESQPVA